MARRNLKCPTYWMKFYIGDKKKWCILDLFYKGVKFKVKDKVRLIIETEG